MIKRRSITKSFRTGLIERLIDNFINEYLEKYNVIEIKEISHCEYMFVTIIYEMKINEDGELLKKIVKISENMNIISINTIQNELTIGFNRAAIALQSLEDLSIVSSKPRRLLVSYEDAEKIIDEYYK